MTRNATKMNFSHPKWTPAAILKKKEKIFENVKVIFIKNG
jgi:hypothetical protein